MSLKELSKRQKFIGTISDEIKKKEVYARINDKHFWQFVQQRGLV